MPLPTLFAPLEGVTDAVFRCAHFALFGGVERYYIPFISPTQHMTFTSREQRAVSPIENEGVPVVPQVLTGDPERFVATARLLHDVGYDEVNLNLGCPSGTVTAKGKGSGLLRDVDALRRFFDVVFTNAPCPISIKTRIGFDSPLEWDRLWDVYRQYPFRCCIVHPRTRSEFYKGSPHTDAFERCSAASLPMVYNGDLNTMEDLTKIGTRFPFCSALMIGRGLVTNPAMAREWAGGASLTREELRSFHDRLLSEYRAKWAAKAVLGHMQEIMWYMLCCFDDTKKVRKALRKAQTVEAYLGAVNRLFETCPFRERPAFHFDET